LLSFNGEKWTRKIIETLDNEKWLCEKFKRSEIMQSQITVVRNLQKKRNDKIFWIVLDKDYDRSYDQLFKSKIFEILTINGGLHLKSFGDFGESMQKYQSFPKVITPRKNGKFVVCPDRVGFDYGYVQDPILFIEVETLEMNQGSNWSSINFHLNISDNLRELWILQV